ncbi:MAG: Crp/Fnr family transcriptional regulator [Chthonomonas sp.]|nr:Crp/Fnr family transcriptional regulator [Chthonomonas sp.]
MAVEHDIVALLRGSPYLGGLSSAELGLLADSGRRATYRKGDILMEEGQPGQTMFVILHGYVEILQSTYEGNSRLVATRGPGDVIGELSLFDGKPRSAAAVAKETCRVLAIGQEVFEERLRRNSNLALSMLRSMAGVIREQNEKLSQPSDARSRVINYIAQCAKERPGSDDAVVVVDLHYNAAQLAPHLSMKRETLSRMLSELHEARVLTRDGRTRIHLHQKRFWSLLGQSEPQ